MSGTIAIDTLAIAKRFKSHGFTEDQAEIQAEVLAEVVETNLVTRQYLDMKTLNLGKDIDIKILELRKDIAEMRNDIFKWIIPLMLGQSGVTAYLVKLIIAAH